MFTGVGKTYATILCFKELDAREEKLIIVPSVFLQEQWKAELAKHHIINWRVLVINTAIKNKHTTGILVLDEAHKYASLERRKIFDLVSFTNGKKVIGLTATMERQDNLHYIVENYSPVIFRLGVKEALSKDLTPDFIIYNLPVRLTNAEKTIYSNLDKSFGHFFGFFSNDFDEAIACVKSPSRRRVHSESTGVDLRTVNLNTINFSRAMGKRKSFLHNLPEKLKVIKEIVEKFKGKKIITFSELVKTTTALKKEIPNSKVYYATDKKEKKEKLIEDYKNSKFMVLHTAKALDEGADIPDIEIGIIHSSTSTKLQTTQRNGRILRKIGNKIPIIINLYVEDINGKPTQDKKWLIKRLEGMPNVYWINSISEITYSTDNKLSEEVRSNLISERLIY